ncbi:polygalacturonase QRT3-like [Neltuma alba]|uniref:polygalacturonase QRT3-like n=1 Tax=Neltuma alba TaxID=207710 RepID=UPI0010A3C7E1|nr:polygalacturonase QRT3-like [Prosopis alba]
MITRFSAVGFAVLFLLSQQESTCFSTTQTAPKLSEFSLKLHQKLIAAAASPETKITKGKTRVVYPAEYGGDPTGEEESSEAFEKALEEAFAMATEGRELVRGVRDLGGVVIDLEGGSYRIGKPISFPSSGGGNLVVKSGSLRAAETFPSDRYLVELSSSNSSQLDNLVESLHVDGISGKKAQNDVIHYEDISFRDILFDSSYRGGGISIADSARIRINSCFFLHFTTEGILVQRGHETFISSCFLGQHSTVGGDIGEKDYSGTAIDLASNDNAITDVVIFSAAIGITLRGQANMITGVHCYNKATSFGGIGILVKLAGNSQTRIDNCYLDYAGIVMEDPVQVHVTNGLFLGDANIVLKSIKGQVLGLNIVNNMFSGDPNKKVPIVNLDGQFGDIDQVVIDQNNVNGMGLRSTIGKLTVGGNGTKWIVDFSGVLVFPNRISFFQYSFYAQEPKFVAHCVTNVSDNVVVVETNEAVKGLVSFSVEQ